MKIGTTGEDPRRHHHSRKCAEDPTFDEVQGRSNAQPHEASNDHTSETPTRYYLGLNDNHNKS